MAGLHRQTAQEAARVRDLSCGADGFHHEAPNLRTLDSRPRSYPQFSTPSSPRNSIEKMGAVRDKQRPLVEKILPIQRVALRGTEAGVADNATQFFFRRAVGHACGAHYIFF